MDFALRTHNPSQLHVSNTTFKHDFCCGPKPKPAVFFFGARENPNHISSDPGDRSNAPTVCPPYDCENPTHCKKPMLGFSPSCRGAVPLQAACGEALSTSRPPAEETGVFPTVVRATPYFSYGNSGPQSRIIREYSGLFWI